MVKITKLTYWVITGANVSFWLGTWLVSKVSFFLPRISKCSWTPVISTDCATTYLFSEKKIIHLFHKYKSVEHEISKSISKNAI